MKVHLLLVGFMMTRVLLIGQDVYQIDYVQLLYNSKNNFLDSHEASLHVSQKKSLYVHSKKSNGKFEKSYWSDDIEWFRKHKEATIEDRAVDKYGAGVFRDLVSNRVQIREFFMIQPYIVEEEEGLKQNWAYSDEEENILGLVCKKATCTFRGRNYTAWYAPEIPISSGPWKLSGTPGLIIKAYDDLDEVLFLPVRIGKSTITIDDIKPFEGGVKHSFEEYKIGGLIEFEKMKKRSLSINPQQEIIYTPGRKIELSY